MQDKYKISKISKINTTAHGPSRDRAAPGLGRAWAGPAAAWYFVFILDILYMFGYVWIYVWYFFCADWSPILSNFDEATNEKLP